MNDKLNRSVTALFLVIVIGSLMVSFSDAKAMAILVALAGGWGLGMWLWSFTDWIHGEKDERG